MYLGGRVMIIETQAALKLINNYFFRLVPVWSFLRYGEF